jgi:Domain of unknown function (DUF4157)
MAYEPREHKASARPNGLPAPLLAGHRERSGHDLSGVQVHRNSSLPAAVGALAYTQGQNIYLAPGQDHHLAHESAHVVQQMDGRVKPTIEVNGAPVNDDASLEREADAAGGEAHRIGTHALQRLTDPEEDEKLKKT